MHGHDHPTPGTTRVNSIKIWLQSRLPAYVVDETGAGDAFVWRLRKAPLLPPSYLQIPKPYFRDSGIPTADMLEVLDRLDFPGMVALDEEEGVSFILTREGLPGSAPLVLREVAPPRWPGEEQEEAA